MDSRQIKKKLNQEQQFYFFLKGLNLRAKLYVVGLVRKSINKEKWPKEKVSANSFIIRYIYFFSVSLLVIAQVFLHEIFV